MGELNTAVPALGLSSGVHVPVLVVVGDFNGAFCNPPTCSAGPAHLRRRAGMDEPARRPRHEDSGAAALPPVEGSET